MVQIQRSTILFNQQIVYLKETNFTHFELWLATASHSSKWVIFLFNQHIVYLKGNKVYPLRVVARGSETQFEMGENLNYLRWQSNGWTGSFELRV